MEGSATIPGGVLERLSVYLATLVRLLANQEVLVSSEELAEVAGVNPAQVRKDLRYLVQSGGTPGVGYEVRRLIYEIEEVLGITKPKEAVLVGAGRLGSALVQYPGFDRYGLDIVALFDVDERKVGQKIGEKPILPLAKLSDLPLRLGIRLGIVCVPAEAAQGVVDLMVRAGIKVIWNFAPAQLQVPADVFVKNEDLAAQLAKLSYHIEQERRAGLAAVDSKQEVDSASVSQAHLGAVWARASNQGSKTQSRKALASLEE